MDISVEHLYDEYLDAAMAGRLIPPDEFLRDKGVQDDSLRQVLAVVYAEHVRSASTPDPPSEPGLHASPPSRPAKADVLGDFLLLSRLGEGGMGVVFLAEQISLRRRVALKLLRPEIASSKAAAARFEREALAAARLNHPNIVSVIAVGEHKGARYIAMEYVGGRGLDEILKEARVKGESIAVPRAVRWCAQIARALSAAHSHGIIHRDVKPSNIRITDDDRALLLDFGVARDLDDASPTLTETFVGSPFYAAPEQVAARGGAVDARTDVYSVGVVLYEAITGVMPFSGKTLEQVLHAILTHEPPPPRRCIRAVPRDVDTIVMKAMDKNAPRRYQSASDLAEDLEAVLELRPISARPHGVVERVARWARRRRPLATAIASAALVLVLAVAFFSYQAFERQRTQSRATQALIDEAHSLVDAYAQSRKRIAAEEAFYESLLSSRGGRYMTVDEDAKVDAAEARVRDSRREREAMFYRVLDLASQAERSGASAQDTELLRARAYFQRYLEAESVQSIDQTLYRDLVRRHDSGGILASDLRGSTHLSISSPTPGVTINVFRRVYDSDFRQGGERRLINVPLRGWPSNAPQGAWALRVTSGAGTLVPGDQILEVASRPIRGTVFVTSSSTRPARGDVLREIDSRPVDEAFWAYEFEKSPPTRSDGHVYRFETASGMLEIVSPSLSAAGIRVGNPIDLALQGAVAATIWTPSGPSPTTLPEGLRLRTTAAPLWISELSLVDPPAARKLELEPGDYLVLLQAPGMEPMRIPVGASRDSTTKVSFDLHPIGTAPEDFVRIIRENTPETWIMDHEVTFREYFEFLNDPETLKEIDSAAPRIIRYPFNGEEALGQRGPDGKFLLPEGWSFDWPVLHVSMNDAKAYAAWRTRRDTSRNSHFEFDLPELYDWLAASSAPKGKFVYGDRFMPKWCSSCFARTKPLPEPVLSFPIDESACGVFDLAGSVSEWTTTPWQENLPHMRHAGGSWASGDAELFTSYGGNGMLPDRNAGFIGFRLVMRRTQPTSPNVK